MCPNRGSQSIDAKTLLLWNLPPKAGAKYVSPGLVNEGSGLQSSELSLYDLIHLSLIGRGAGSVDTPRMAIVGLVCSWSSSRSGRDLDLLLRGILGGHRIIAS